MLLSREQIKEAAMQLEFTERERLAEELLLSITPAEREEIDRQWIAVARKRHEDMVSQGNPGRPVSEVIDRLLRKAQK